MRLERKIAVVTGGTRGLGRAIAEGFLSEGAKVVCAAREEAPVKDLIEANPGRVAFVPVDVSEHESVSDLFAKTVELFGGVDIVVANAAVEQPGRVDTLAPDRFAAALATNLTGVYHCIHSAVPHLLARGGGRIITLSSTLGQRPMAGGSAYCASKAAVEMLTKVSALELAAQHITVNCLSPGITDTGMSKALAANEKMWGFFLPKLATGRPARSAEIAEAANFLAGDASSYVNGHVLQVDGAMRW